MREEQALEDRRLTGFFFSSLFGGSGLFLIDRPLPDVSNSPSIAFAATEHNIQHVNTALHASS